MGSHALPKFFGGWDALSTQKAYRAIWRFSACKRIFQARSFCLPHALPKNYFQGVRRNRKQNHSDTLGGAWISLTHDFAEGNSSAPMTQIAKIEIHPIETVTLADKQFLTGSKDGIAARIAGELRLPPGTAVVPAVILVHGSDGIGANVDRWARELNGIGAAAFLLDSFTGRGITQTVTDQTQLGHLAMISDAYRSLDLLSKHSRIDSSRIAVMGFSKGGFVALYSSLKRFQRMHGPTSAEFAAYIPFYAPCNTVYIEDELVSDRPIRLFHGTADDYVSIEPCRKYVERLRRAGKDVQLTEYAGARHVFDNPTYSPPCPRPDALISSRCSREERPGGEIVNLETDQPFRWSDDCVRRGATLAYDPVATAAAMKAVTAFLISTFKLNE
jgi:dienelactone hydrolase